MQITSLEQLQAIKQTEIVELPSFEDGTPFVVEIKKPNRMQLMTSGKIPNTLLSVATEMFNGKTGQVMGKASEDIKTLKELVGMMEVLAEASLVKPSDEACDYIISQLEQEKKPKWREEQKTKEEKRNINLQLAEKLRKERR